MQGVLIVGHGSREKSVEKTLEAVAEMVQAKLPETPMEIAYMERGKQDIPSGLLKLADRGADEIAVAPYFLFEGTHLRKDIPAILAAYRRAHPDCEIVTADPLGADERLAAILADRIRDCLCRGVAGKEGF